MADRHRGESEIRVADSTDKCCPLSLCNM